MQATTTISDRDWLIRLLGADRLAEFAPPLTNPEIAKVRAAVHQYEASPLVELALKAVDADGRIVDHDAFDRLNALSLEATR